jgi:hypothetical protein
MPYSIEKIHVFHLKLSTSTQISCNRELWTASKKKEKEEKKKKRKKERGKKIVFGKVKFGKLTFTK